VSLADSLFLWSLLGNPARAALAPSLRVEAAGGWAQGLPYPALEASFKVKEDAGAEIRLLPLALFSSSAEHSVRDEERLVDVIHQKTEMRSWALVGRWGRRWQGFLFGLEAGAALAQLSDEFWSDSGVLYEPVSVQGGAKALSGGAGAVWEGPVRLGAWARHWKELGGERTQSEVNDFVSRKTLVPWAPAAGLGTELGMSAEKGPFGLTLLWAGQIGVFAEYSSTWFGMRLGWAQAPGAWAWARYERRPWSLGLRLGYWRRPSFQVSAGYFVP